MSLTCSLRFVEPCFQCGHCFEYGDLIRCPYRTITCPVCGVENPVYVRPVMYSEVLR